ncbi:MAG: transposase, partial [Methylococcaceae bacterium]|nr:transposase [Methylococcaceae bacterium]
HTLPDVLSHIESSRGKEVKHAVCDRGYRGKKQFGNTEIILPASPLKRDNRYQRDKKRKRCRRRAAIEPIIGHLKTDFRLTRNFLKGIPGDSINLLMAACAWNMAKWMREAILFLFVQVLSVKIVLRNARQQNVPLLRLSGNFLRNFEVSENLSLRLFQG